MLQVLQDTVTGMVTTSSTSFQDTGLEQAITPASASNKVLVIANVNGYNKPAGNNANAVKLEIDRGGVQVFTTSDIIGYNGASNQDSGAVTLVYLDSPATTSATTYKIRFASAVSGQNVGVQAYNVSNTVNSSIVVMEIGA